MATHPKLSSDLVPAHERPPCLQAAFREAGDNPLLAVSAVDARGEFFALNTAASPPGFVEVIHSRPQVVRGNHLHRRCTETLTVLSGAIALYLLCGCPGRHVFRTRMDGGASVCIPPGTGHAIHTLAETEIVSVFTDADPREDRERVELICQ